MDTVSSRGGEVTGSSEHRPRRNDLVVVSTGDENLFCGFSRNPRSNVVEDDDRPAHLHLYYPKPRVSK